MNYKTATCTKGLNCTFNFGNACPYKAGETWTRISEYLSSSFNHSTYERASFDGPLYCTVVAKNMIKVVN